MSSKILRIFIATRPWSFTATVTVVLLGNICSYMDSERFHVGIAILSFCCVLSVHCAANLVNTYYDFVNGVDTKYSDDTTLVKGTLKPQEIFSAFICAYGVALLLKLCLIYMINFNVFISAVLFFIGLIFSYLYTGGIGLKYYAFGDVIIMFAFGPLIAIYCYLNQNLTFSWKPIFYSLPLVFHIEAMLHANNIRDIDLDKAAGVKTIVIIFGREISVYIFYALLAIPYFLIFPMMYIQSYFFLLSYFTVPIAINIAMQCHDNKLKNLPLETAKLNLLFGLTYLFAVVLNGLL